MNRTLEDKSKRAALGDSTLASFVFAPKWVQKTKNSTLLLVDTAGFAHKPGSKCWNRPNVRRAGTTTVVSAMVNHHLCDRCG